MTETPEDSTSRQREGPTRILVLESRIFNDILIPVSISLVVTVKINIQVESEWCSFNIL